ncbi:Flagellar assembly protein FliH [Methylophilaceae bacterium]|nr:Flagellar assembly protein FliH [Methylophilaceae bacterium]
MSNSPLPKAQETAYQRWEMNSLSAGNSHHAKKVDREKSKVPEGLALILENARKDGFKQGLQEGFQAGMQKAEEISAENEHHFLQIGNAFQAALQDADAKIAEDLLRLALDIAKAMLKSSLEVDSRKILPIVRDSIRYLPVVKHPARILLNPADVQMVNDHLSEELAEGGWQIIEDATIERGGCMVDTSSNQIDATNATRWKRISEALGQPSEWLNENEA